MDVSIFFVFLFFFFFFFVELFVSLATSFVDEWKLGLVNVFQKIRLIEYIKSLKSLIPLLSRFTINAFAMFRFVKMNFMVQLLLNYISERRRCRCASLLRNQS